MFTPISKGGRFIIMHAGGEKGFIKDCLTMWKSAQSTGDYHNEINSKNYMKRLQEKLIPNLPEKSVLVIDNAPYHNVELSKCPSTSSKKVVVQEWLRSHS